MPNNSNYTLEELKDLVESMNDISRLRIFNLLLHYNKPLVQGDIGKALKLGQSLMGRHFTYLKSRKVITHQRHAMYVYFEISPKFKETIKTFIKSIQVKELDQDISYFKSIKKELALDSPIKDFNYNKPNDV